MKTFFFPMPLCLNSTYSRKKETKKKRKYEKTKVMREAMKN